MEQRVDHEQSATKEGALSQWSYTGPNSERATVILQGRNTPPETVPASRAHDWRWQLPKRSAMP
jgi:hypothetical protein